MYFQLQFLLESEKQDRLHHKLKFLKPYMIVICYFCTLLCIYRVILKSLVQCFRGVPCKDNALDSSYSNSSSDQNQYFIVYNQLFHLLLCNIQQKLQSSCIKKHLEDRSVTCRQFDEQSYILPALFIQEIILGGEKKKKK